MRRRSCLHKYNNKICASAACFKDMHFFRTPMTPQRQVVCEHHLHHPQHSPPALPTCEPGLHKSCIPTGKSQTQVSRKSGLNFEGLSRWLIQNNLSEQMNLYWGRRSNVEAQADPWTLAPDPYRPSSGVLILLRSPIWAVGDGPEEDQADSTNTAGPSSRELGLQPPRITHVSRCPQSTVDTVCWPLIWCVRFIRHRTTQEQCWVSL